MKCNEFFDFIVACCRKPFDSEYESTLANFGQQTSISHQICDMILISGIVTKSMKTKTKTQAIGTSRCWRFSRFSILLWINHYKDWVSLFCMDRISRFIMTSHFIGIELRRICNSIISIISTINPRIFRRRFIFFFYSHGIIVQ